MNDITHFDIADCEKNKYIAWPAYLGILFLIPLIIAPTSSFARFHTNQGIVYFIFSLIAGAAAIAVMRIPVLGSYCSLAIFILLAVMTLYGVITAVSGKTKRFPIIGHIQILPK